MKNYIQEGTDSSLYINFNCESNHLIVSGESRPENCSLFFNPLLEWMKEYKDYLASSSANTNVTVSFKIDYFNSTSAKFLTDLFLLLKEIKALKNVDLTVEWHYKSIDEEILESGEDFQEIAGVKLDFLPFE